MSLEHEAWLAERLEEEVSKRVRLEREAHMMLAAIIRSQGESIRVTRAALLEASRADVITRLDDPVTSDVVFRLRTLPLREVTG